MPSEPNRKTKNTSIGARFTAVGVITPDPASVESVLSWANRLQDRVQYVVVQNATSRSQTSATGTRPNRQFGLGTLCHQMWFGWNFVSPNWRIQRGSTEYGWGRLPRGRIRSMN